MTCECESNWSILEGLCNDRKWMTWELSCPCRNIHHISMICEKREKMVMFTCSWTQNNVLPTVKMTDLMITDTQDKQLWIKLSLFLQPQNNNHIFHNKFNCLWALDLFAWAKCQNNQLQCQNPTSITTWSQASYFPALWTGHVKLLRVLIEQFFFRFVNAVCFLDLWFQGHSALIQQFFSLDVFRFVNAVCFFDL